jgi:hypothetical protein
MSTQSVEARQTELPLKTPSNPRLEELEPKIREKVIDLVSQLMLSMYAESKKQERRNEYAQNQ